LYNLCQEQNWGKQIIEKSVKNNNYFFREIVMFWSRNNIFRIKITPYAAIFKIGTTKMPFSFKNGLKNKTA